MKRIPVPTVSFANTTTTLNGEAYNLTFRWSEVKNRWKLDIYDASFNPVLLGITLIEEQDLTGYYSYASKVMDGFLFIAKMTNTTELVGRNNLGLNKDYELVYVSNNE